MPPVDKRQVLTEEVFTYRANKDGKVFIYWRGQLAKVLAGPAAQKFLGQIVPLDDHAAQLLMAKATGNFKRGNER